MTTDTTTVAVSAVVIARDDVSEDDVYNFVKDIFDNAPDLVSSHAKYKELSIENGDLRSLLSPITRAPRSTSRKRA